MCSVRASGAAQRSPKTQVSVQLRYNARAGSLTILTMETHNGAEVHPVPPGFIEDKPLASAPHGFDQEHQVLIAFPKVQIGSRLRLRYRRQLREVPLPGVFGQSFVFGWGEAQRAAEVHIRSALPLRVQKNDPPGALAVSLSKDRSGDTYVLTARLRRPVHMEPVDEPAPFLAGDRLVWLDVTSSQSHADLVRPLLAPYEAVATAPLPSAYQRILEAARGKDGLIAQANEITAGLQGTLRYLGDWRPIRGGHIPRPLAETAESHFGDCKDFAIATVAILRRLGHRAHVAVVQRGAKPVLSPTDLPMMSEYNHAIVYIDDDGGAGRFLDPTNTVSFAQGIFEDIMDRPALVLDPAGPRLLRTPAGAPAEAVTRTRLVLHEEPGQALRTEGSLALLGRAALQVAGAELDQSRQSIAYDVVSRLSDRARLRAFSVDGYDLRSRIAADTTFQVRYTEDGPDARTSAGPGVALQQGKLIQTLLTQTRERVSDLILGRPQRLEEERLLRGMHLVGSPPRCEIASPWARLRREVRQTPAGIQVKDEVEISRWLVPAAELAGPRFRALQDQIRACFANVVLVYSPAPQVPALLLRSSPAYPKQENDRS
jgi:hypothetical protein